MTTAGTETASRTTSFVSFKFNLLPINKAIAINVLKIIIPILTGEPKESTAEIPTITDSIFVVHEIAYPLVLKIGCPTDNTSLFFSLLFYHQEFLSFLRSLWLFSSKRLLINVHRFIVEHQEPSPEMTNVAHEKTGKECYI